MAYHADLSTDTYLKDMYRVTLTSIGWLEGHMPYTQGSVSSEVVQKIAAICAPSNTVATNMGYQECSLCDTPKLHHWEGIPYGLGNGNFIVPGVGDTIYLFPNLILHYIRDHGYAPPAEFCEAVLQCPDPNSAVYRELLEFLFARRNTR
jgi:hypothetical protein